VILIILCCLSSLLYQLNAFAARLPDLMDIKGGFVHLCTYVLSHQPLFSLLLLKLFLPGDMGRCGRTRRQPQINMARISLFICLIFLSVIWLFSHIDIDSHFIHHTTSTAPMTLLATGCALKTEPRTHTFSMAKLLWISLEGNWLHTIWHGQGNQLETVVGLSVVTVMSVGGVAVNWKADIGIVAGVATI